MATPEEILAVIEKNVSKQNRWEVNMTLPNLPELTSNSSLLDSINYYCQEGSLPSQNLTLSEIKYLGVNRYAYIFMDIDSIILTFFDTREQILRNTFIDWQKAIVPDNKVQVLQYYPNEYTTKFRLKSNDKSYEAIGASPINIGDFRLSHQGENQLGTFDVTFKIKQFNAI